MSRCGSTETVSGDACQRGANCPYHRSDRTQHLQPKKKRAAELLRAGDHNRTAIADALGIDRTTLWRWTEKHEELAEAAKEGDRVAYEDIVDSWYDRLRRGECSAAEIIFFVKNKAPDEWQDVRRTELSGPQGGPIEVDVDDARERLSRRVARIAERRRAASGSRSANGGRS